MSGARRDWGPLDKTAWQTRHLPFLPDHLVRRSGYVASRTTFTDEEVRGEPLPTTRLDVTRVDGMDWRGFFEACSRAASTDSVIARPREAEEIERVLADADLAPALNKPDVPREALAALFEVAARNTTAQYFAVVDAGTGGWTARQRELLSAQCIAHDGPETLTLGIVPLRSWSAANALRDSAFRTARSVRIFSARTPVEIAATLSPTS